MCAVCSLAIWLAHTYKSCMITVAIFENTIYITALMHHACAGKYVEVTFLVCLKVDPTVECITW